MVSLTAELANFTASLELSAIPEAARRIAKTGFADCVAVMVAGAREPAVALVDRELAGTGNAAQASLIPSGERRNVEDAALVNGVAAHVLDYDDVALDGHPSAVLVPAILAEAEAGDAGGAEMLTAYAAGYEVWAELLARLPGPMHEKGWHPTAVLGTVAAAAACARMRKLDARRTAAAMAASGSMAAGLVANFGTMTKSFQVGRAAQSGAIAARLAAAGFTASPDVLEHPAGFLAAFASGKRAEPPPLAAKGEWNILRHGLNVKRYPMCYATHRLIDGALGVVGAHDVRPRDIERIHVRTGRTQMVMLRNHCPQTGLEAKFSVEFAMAAAVVARRVGLRELTDEFVRRPEIRAVMERVTYETTDRTAPGLPFAPADSVEITVGDKPLASGPVAHARGSHELPLEPAQLREKFDDCLDGAPEAARARTFEALMALERANSVAALGLTRLGAIR